MTDAADFTRQAAELVAENDRVPTQRTVVPMLCLGCGVETFDRDHTCDDAAHSDAWNAP